MSFAALRADVLAGRSPARITDLDHAGWADAAVAAARGDFERSERLCRSLAGAEARVAFAALITLGSALRQTGRFTDARDADQAALEAAADDAERADALIGLAADAVGLNAPESCAALLIRAARATPVGQDRLQVRLGWVQTEHALLTLEARKAVAHARIAVHQARLLRSPRHLAKSMLFLGAALDACGDGEADRWLADAMRTADAIGARPIASAAQGLLRGRSRLPETLG